MQPITWARIYNRDYTFDIPTFISGLPSGNVIITRIHPDWQGETEAWIRSHRAMLTKVAKIETKGSDQ